MHSSVVLNILNYDVELLLILMSKDVICILRLDYFFFNSHKFTVKNVHDNPSCYGLNICKKCQCRINTSGILEFSSDSMCSSLFGLLLPFLKDFLFIKSNKSIFLYTCLHFVSDRTKCPNGK